MSPTVLLADPSVRLAGVRTARAAAGARPVRWRRIVVAWLVMAACCGLAYLRTWPPLATVMSGSMAPTIDTGDVVLLKRLERPARVGDVVSIAVPDEARSRFGYPPVVIHRIVAIDPAGIVSTKGDARKEPDPFNVPSTALTTRVVATVPAAGRGLAFLGSPLGLLWLVGGGALLIGMPLLERYRDGQRRVAGERDGLQAAVATLTVELVALREAREDSQDRAFEAAERERLAAEAHQRRSRSPPNASGSPPRRGTKPWPTRPSASGSPRKRTSRRWRRRPNVSGSPPSAISKSWPTQPSASGSPRKHASRPWRRRPSESGSPRKYASSRWRSPPSASCGSSPRPRRRARSRGPPTRRSRAISASCPR